MSPKNKKGTGAWRARTAVVFLVVAVLCVQLWSVLVTAPGGDSVEAAERAEEKRDVVVVEERKKAVSGKEKTVAYAISVTKDGSYMDGAAVLAHSAIRVHRGSLSAYGVALVAFVAPAVTSLEQLRVCGYRVLRRDLPLEVADIKGERLRQGIKSNGCCGAWELLKLYAWTLTEYHRVVHVDMDVAILQNLDELFQDDSDLWWRQEEEGKSVVAKDGSESSSSLPPEKKKKKKKKAIYALYTWDWTMARGKNKPVQGGFLVAKPSMEIYEALVDVVREGDFRSGSGWGGTGAGTYWGGMTIQGLLPYFFETVRPGRGRDLDECVYNNMANNPRDVGGFDKGRCRRDATLHPKPCKDCRLVSVDTIKTVHFTICQKPWGCVSASRQSCPYCPICAKLHAMWFDIRKEMETEWGTYNTLDYAGTARERHGMCGKSGYKPVPIHKLMKNHSLAQKWRDSWHASASIEEIGTTTRR